VVAGAPPATLSELAVHELYREDFVAIVRRDDPLARRQRIAIADLAERDLLLVPATAYTGQVVHEACAAAGIKPRIRLELASGEALRETVRCGLGLTVLPTGYLSGDDPDLRAIPLSDPAPQRSVLLLEDPRRQPSRAAQAFIRQLVASKPPAPTVVSGT